MITELNDRAQAVLRSIVDQYMATGEPAGSRTISKMLELDLSAATIRNVMADLEGAGLLFAPHTSAGRLPTQAGLRLYVDGLMQIGDISEQDRTTIEAQCAGAGETMNQVLERATGLLAGLSAAAGLVVAPKTDKPGAADSVHAAGADQGAGHPGHAGQHGRKPRDGSAAGSARDRPDSGSELPERTVGGTHVFRGAA